MLPRGRIGYQTDRHDQYSAAGLQEPPIYSNPPMPMSAAEEHDRLLKEAAVNRGRTMMRVLVLASGIGLLWSMTGPASAQFECPPGYYYVPGYDCQLPNTPYAVPEYYPDYDYHPRSIQEFHRWGDDRRDDRRGAFERGGSGRGDSEHGAGRGHR
jgi:hypothetical protein